MKEKQKTDSEEGRRTKDKVFGLFLSLSLSFSHGKKEG